MKDRLRSKVWWARIDKDAENFVKTCELLNSTKDS